MRKEFYYRASFECDNSFTFGAHKEGGKNFDFPCVCAIGKRSVRIWRRSVTGQEIPMYQEGQSGVYVSEPIPAKTGQLYKYCNLHSEMAEG